MLVLVLRCIVGGLAGGLAGLQLWMDLNRIDDDW
jgi:hypothetical protein